MTRGISARVKRLELASNGAARPWLVVRHWPWDAPGVYYDPAGNAYTAGQFSHLRQTYNLMVIHREKYEPRQP